MPYLPKPEKKQVNNHPGGTSSDLQNSRWRTLRKSILRRSPLCESCLSVEILNDVTGTRAAHLDHIVPRKLGGAVYDLRNIAVLCASCHAKKSALERHGLNPVAEMTDAGLIPAPGQKLIIFHKIHNA